MQMEEYLLRIRILNDSLLSTENFGVDEQYIFVDKMSGKDFDRPRYQALRLLIREGDLVYMEALGRLGRPGLRWDYRSV